jgi:hypothetical protein
MPSLKRRSRLLELKFGKLNEDAERCIDSATVPALERYTERALTASTLAEVLSD